tara:strand:+ start:1100 stop:1705 length:606 start_codon:yes stop_codon:yes gene_type:complete
MTFAGFGFLLFGSYVAAFNPSAQELDYYERAMGIIGLFVFGFSFILTVIAIFRSWKRGLLTISRDGIHIAHYGTTFHWRHVSPAWINEVGDKNSKNVCFILACSDSYKAMSRIGKVLNWISLKSINGKFGKSVLIGCSVLMVKEGEDPRPLIDALNQLREKLYAAPGAMPISIPCFYHFGVPADDVAYIINDYIATQSKLS